MQNFLNKQILPPSLPTLVNTESILTREIRLETLLFLNIHTFLPKVHTVHKGKLLTRYATGRIYGQNFTYTQKYSNRTNNNVTRKSST